MSSYKDLSLEQIKGKVYSISRRAHERCDSFVLFYSGHGGTGTVYSHDEMHVPIEDIVEEFQPSKCPGLIDKPKVKITEKKNPKLSTCTYYIFNTKKTYSFFNEKQNTPSLLLLFTV